MNRIGILIVGLCLLTPPLLAKNPLQGQEVGNLRIFVIDNNGMPAMNAPVYIVDARQTLRVLLSDEGGFIDIDIRSGGYTFSSAQARESSGYIERVKSPSVYVHIVPDENLTLLLTLHASEQDPAPLYLSTLKKIGVLDQVSQYTNQ